MAQSDVNLIFSSGQAITATAASTGYYDAGNTRGGLTFVTAVESGVIITALLTAYTKIWAPWWPHRAAFAAATNGSVPRFYQINYTVGGSNFGTAAITAAVAQTRDDNPAIFYGPGFTVGA
jgi:hypothetical protein